jgi:hypothetical protein
MSRETRVLLPRVRLPRPPWPAGRNTTAPGRARSTLAAVPPRAPGAASRRGVVARVRGGALGEPQCPPEPLPHCTLHRARGVRAGVERGSRGARAENAR